MRTWRPFATMAGATLLGAAGAPAGAVLVDVQITGHVEDYFAGNPDMGLDVTGVFGPAGGRINGDAYSALIRYDTALAPPDSSTSPAVGRYDHEYYQDGNWSFLSISVTINGHTETVDGATNYQLALVDPPGSPLYFAVSNHTHDSSVGTPYDESFIDFTFNALPGATVVGSTALPTTANVAGISNRVGKVGDLDLARGVYGTPNTVTAQLLAYLDLDAVASWAPASPVPEPAGRSLWLAGAAALAAWCTRRRFSG